MIATLFSLLIGFLLVIGSAVHVNKDTSIFMDPIGIALVIGGTCVVACITFTPKKAWRLAKTCIAVMRQKTDDAPIVAREIIAVVRDTRCEIPALQSRIDSVKNPFLRDGISLVCDRLDAPDIESILRDRIRIKQENDESTANMLRTLAKYPPSLGIIGTVLGLIAMMMQLGTDGSTDKLGPAMALGLVATFYGLVFTNFFLQPLSENLATKSVEDIRKRQIALLGIMMIKANKQPIVVQEAVNSLLPVAERIDELGIGGAGGAARSSGGRAA